MTETQDVKKGRGTGWIIAGGIVLALCFVQLVTTPFVIATADGDSGVIGGKLIAVVFLGALGTWWLVWGLRKRRSVTGQ